MSTITPAGTHSATRLALEELRPSLDGPSPARRIRDEIDDTRVVVGRNLRRLSRMPQLIVFATVQPVMFVLMFRYVFGGAIEVPGLDYVQYLLPGIFVQTVTFGAIQTGISLADDAGEGLIERMRTLPMSRAAMLTGRTLADLLRNSGVVVLMVLVGYLVGFRITGGVAASAVGFALVLGFAFAFSWIGALVGLATKDAESTQAAMFPLLFPLVFASSAFLPTATMPSWLQGFADNQPFSVVVNATRSTVVGGSFDGVGTALAWIVGITAVFAPLAVRRYRRG